jgi:CRP/FNR family transcriptional regulator, cyclic AMP receptor protein
LAVDVARLSKIPLFDDLPEDQLASLALWLDEEATKAGRGVTHEGTSGYAFFVIEEGEARVMRGDEELRRLGPGDFFGEAAILGDGRRTADVVAETDLELLAMFGTRFRALQMEMPELAAMIEATMHERLER